MPDRKIDLRDGKRIRSTLIRCSTNQAQLFRLDLQIFFPYLPTVPYPAGFTPGPTTRMTKTLRKVLVSVNIPADLRSDMFPEASALDTWVFDRLETLFRNATLDPPLERQLRQERTVFFLHLLGLDVTGHSHRPHSRVSAPIAGLLLLGSPCLSPPVRNIWKTSKWSTTS